MVFKATHFQQYFSYIVVVSFIGGGNQSTRRKPPTCHKSLTTLSHKVVSNIVKSGVEHTIPPPNLLYTGMTATLYHVSYIVQD